MSSTSPPPPVLPPELVAPLRADLAAADHTVEGIARLLGPVASDAVQRDDLIPARRVLDRRRAGSRGADDPADDGAEALAVLLRLFGLGDPVGERELATAFPRTGIDGVLRIGLVAADGGTGYRATCDLRPYGDERHAWWVASDLAEVTTGEPLLPDHVLGVGGASLTLASWTPRIPAGRVLDLGTGCGVQALHADSHAGAVVATDLSERALAYAAFNAALAGQAWDLRAGDLFDPVRRDGVAETFDLVVSNPPFVISPRAAGLPTYEYRDGGRAGDTLVQSVVRGLGEHLAPGGVACVLVDWEVGEGEDWRDRWHEWLGTPECADLDAWVIARDRQDAAEYAQTWSRDGGHRPGTAEHERWVTAWLDDFESRDVASIWFGVLVLQRPAQPRERWVDLTEATGAVDSPMGPRIERGLAARTLLAATSDDALLERTWIAAADVTEERHTRPGEADPRVIVARQGGGLRRVIRLDTAGAAFLGVCDGELPAGVAITAIAALLDEDAAQVRRRVVALLRESIADGLLLAADDPQDAPDR